jgi:energy-coupling factor transport system ATP-binding protein
LLLLDHFALIEVAMPEIIKVEDLSFRYDVADPLVLRDINFSINEGEFVAIMGASGSGKTTLCLALNGIIPNFFGGKFYGYVSVLGRDTLEQSVAEMAQNIGMVLQDPEMQLVTNSVVDEIAFGMENVKVPPEEMDVRIKEVLELVRLIGYEKKHPAMLSGGQKQRLAIAAAVALRPKVMVLDEPTSQLDPIGVDDVFTVIRELNKKSGMTVVLVTHNSERVAEYADRVILIEDGKVASDSTPEKYFRGINLAEKNAVRLPQVTEYFSRFNEVIHKVEPLPVLLTTAVDQMKTVWPEVDFVPQIYPDFDPCGDETKEPVISVRDLHFTYPDGTKALTGISMNVFEGECMAIIGQNGGGKSTLVKHFVRLLKPTSGEVTVFGKSVMNYTTSELAQRIGFIYQNPDAQMFCKTVEEEVGFGPINQIDDKAEVERRVETALRDMDLLDVKDEHPLALSKGDRERVAVAAVLAMEPEVVIFDEPTTGQDISGSRRIMKMIRQLNEKGRTVLIITHHLYLLPGYINRMALLGDGNLLDIGLIREVFHKVEMLRETYLIPPQIVEFGHELEKISGTELNALTVDEMIGLFNSKPSS